MIEVELQNASGAADVPGADEFRRWVEAATKRLPAEVLIRLVDRLESTELNQRYRGKSGPTNVLSFPFQVPPGVHCDLLGDIILCVPLVADEAVAQRKSVLAHWAHLTVHGMLHLQGFDHQEEESAEIMEAEEIAILAELGFQNPYEERVGE